MAAEMGVLLKTLHIRVSRVPVLLVNTVTVSLCWLGVGSRSSFRDRLRNSQSARQALLNAIR